MTNKSITSGQVTEIVELVSASTQVALEGLDLQEDDVQRLIVQRGGEFHKLLMPQIIQIVRLLTAKFDPVAFIGKGWRIDPSDEQLPAAPADIDPVDIVFKNMFRDGEKVLNGEKRIRRHREDGSLVLTADRFFRFWNERDKLPESWKRTDGGDIRVILFDGTIIRDPDGHRCVLGLSWVGGAWNCYCYRLDDDWDARVQSAVAGN